MGDTETVQPMTSIAVSPLRTYVTVRLIFDTPLLAWGIGAEVTGRFFRMIYDCMRPEIAVRPNELSVRPSNNLGEVQARYNVFGGSSAVSLNAESLVVELPGLTKADYPIALNVLRKVHDALPMAFPECAYSTVTSLAQDHLQLPIGVDVSTYLAQFSTVSAVEVFREAAIEPGVHFTIKSNRPFWECTVFAERSALDAGCIFVSRHITLRESGPAISFEQKYGLANVISAGCLRMLALEVSDGD